MVEAKGIYNMEDEIPVKTKTDVLDLIISFLMDHEKRMDQITRRLETLIDKKSKIGNNLEQDQAHHLTRPQANAFTITITNPVNFKEMKSLTIEWETKQEDHAYTDRSIILKTEQSPSAHNKAD